jgi:hypothetical protein
MGVVFACLVIFVVFMTAAFGGLGASREQAIERIDR